MALIDYIPYVFGATCGRLGGAVMIAVSVRDAVWSSEYAKARQTNKQFVNIQVTNKCPVLQQLSNTFHHVQTLRLAGYSYVR